MEKVRGTILVDLVQGATNIPGHALDIIVEQHLKVFLHMANLSKGFMPKDCKRSLRLRRILTVPKPIGSGLSSHRFDIHHGDKVSKEGEILLHVGPDLVDQ